jgi:hypothetical protein
VAHVIPTATPGINQQRPLDRLTPATRKLKKKKQIIYKELKRNMQQRGQGALSTPEQG